MAGKRPNGIPDTGAADKEHKYESATIRSCGVAMTTSLMTTSLMLAAWLWVNFAISIGKP
jgi:hypothetical protein